MVRRTCCCTQTLHLLYEEWGRAVPILPKAGQYIKFYAIDQAEFDRIAALEASGGYTVHTYPRKEAEQA